MPLPTWAVILHSGRIVAVGAEDESHARAVYGYEQDIREVEPYDPLRHLFGRDLAEWKVNSGYTEPTPEPEEPEGTVRRMTDADYMEGANHAG